MSGPWERFQRQEEAQGPWTRFQQAQQPPPAPQIDHAERVRQNLARAQAEGVSPDALARHGAADQQARAEMMGSPSGPPMPPESLGARINAGEGAMPFMTQAPPQAPAEAQAWADNAMDQVRRNVIGGSPPGEETPGERLGTWFQRAADTASFGLLGDEASAAVTGLLPGRDYESELERYRENQRGMSTAGQLSADLSGLLLPGGAAARFVGRGGSRAAQAIRSALLGGSGGAALGFMQGEGGADQRAADALRVGGIGAGVGLAAPSLTRLIERGMGSGQRAARQQLARTSQSGDDLRARAASLYDEARNAGMTATREQTGALSDQMRRVATEEGLITPAGRVAESYPRLRDALNMVDDFAQGTMDPRQMQAVRRTIQDAARSADGAERRIGTMMLREFDDFVGGLAPQFRDANALYARAQRGAIIDEAVELAGVRAGQFSGSGFENALRTEFRRLSRDIARGRMRGLTQDQIAAIRRVADGGSVENFMRGLGRASPSSLMNVSLGGGVPYLVGSSIGGPGAGVAAAAATMGLGAVGRRAATSMQRANAEIAAMLMRSATGSMPAAAQRALPGGVRGLLGFSGSPIERHILSPLREGPAR